jgi:class 3 adenylate cyclase
VRERRRDALGDLFGDSDPAPRAAPGPGSTDAGSDADAGTDADAGARLARIEPRLRSLLPAELYARTWLEPSSDNLYAVFVHLRTMHRILFDQIPRPVAENPPPTGVIHHEWLSGTLMFTDLAGFTTFMEANATDDPASAALVYEVLNRYFATMIDIFGQAGGNLLEFTGDAMLVQFAADARGNDLHRAINAGLRMQRAMSEFAAIETPAGTSSFGMRIGVHVGDYLAADVGTPLRRDHVLFGQTVRTTKAAEGAGVVGRVALSPDAAARLGDAFRLEELPDGHRLVVDDLTAEQLDYFDLNPRVSRPRTPMVLDRSPDALLTDIEDALDLVEPLAGYLPLMVLQVMVETARDRRIPVELADATVMFVKTVGLEERLDPDDEASVDAMVRTFSSLFSRCAAGVRSRGGMLRKVTSQMSGSDMLICFGVLNAHTDSPRRAAEAALVLRDLIAETEGVTCRIGVTRGPVFAAEMGQHLGRREFNIIGDTVNVAARLTAAAEPGTIVVSDTLAADLGPGFTVEARGTRALKGKAGEMEIFELTARS